jgi:AcrR family transcriptional regulator
MGRTQDEMAATAETPEAGARPLRADARRNRDRIVVAAAEAFAAQGADTQMDDVARAAGVGVGTVYRHFPTKEALMGALVRRKIEALQDAAEAALEVADPWEAFAGALRRGAEVMGRDAALRDALNRVPQAWEQAADERARLNLVMARVVRRAQEAGVLREDFSVDDIPMLMCGVSAAMSSPAGWDWRRHLEIMLDGLRVG